SQPRIKVTATAKDSRTQPTTETQLPDLAPPLVVLSTPVVQVPPAQHAAAQQFRSEELDQPSVLEPRPPAISAVPAPLAPDVALSPPSPAAKLTILGPRGDVLTLPTARLPVPQDPNTPSSSVAITVVSTPPAEPAAIVAPTPRSKMSM